MLKKQYKVSYQMLSDLIKDIDEKQADFQLENANNNIKWQLGHLLAANESFIFGISEESNKLGAKLGKSFSPGTSPQEFTGNEPTFEELKEMLAQQIERILTGLDDQLGKTRNEPIAGMDKFDDTIAFAIIHTNYHIGQISLMKTMINKVDQGI